MPEIQHDKRHELERHQLIPIEKVAILLGCSHRTVRRLEADEGSGFPQRVPLTNVRRGRVVFPRCEVVEFVERRTAARRRPS